MKSNFSESFSKFDLSYLTFVLLLNKNESLLSAKFIVSRVSMSASGLHFSSSLNCFNSKQHKIRKNCFFFAESSFPNLFNQKRKAFLCVCLQF